MAYNSMKLEMDLKFRKLIATSSTEILCVDLYLFTISVIPLATHSFLIYGLACL